MAAAHRTQVIGRQVEEREVNGAAAAVAGPSGHVSPLEHLAFLDVRVVASLCPAVLWLLGPPPKAIHSPLRAIAIPEQQAEAAGCSLLSRAVQRSAQSARADNPVGFVS